MNACDKIREIPVEIRLWNAVYGQGKGVFKALAKETATDASIWPEGTAESSIETFLEKLGALAPQYKRKGQE